MTRFLKVDDRIVNADYIKYIDCQNLESNCSITIIYSDGRIDVLNKQPAIDLIMQLAPSMVEGKRLKFIRNRWALHNLLAHPLLQVLAWLGAPRLGFFIHDSTVPRPRSK